MTTIHINWMKIPKYLRVEILNNVFCSTCIQGVEVLYYTISEYGCDLLIKGKCSRCGGQVARMVELDEE